MPLSFEQPWWLLLLLLVVPLAWLARRSEPVLGAFKARLSLMLRILVVLLLTGSLSRPMLERRGEGVSVVVVADESRSIPLAVRRQAEQFVQKAAEQRPNPQDRVGVVTVAAEPQIQALPEVSTVIQSLSHPGETDASDLAAGIRMAIATLPKDTANRLLLVSDGNETAGNLMAAADEARAGGIPIDVLPLRFEHQNEVVFRDLRAPARVRTGQSVDLRLEISAQKETPGVLRMTVDGEPYDLDPRGAGDTRAVTLAAGPNSFQVPVSFDRPGAHRVRAVFEPDAGSGDGMEENNVGEAVVFASGEGRVLIVDESDGSESAPLASALREGGLDVDVARPEVLAGGAAYMGGYDALVLANVARWSLENAADKAVHAYVHDLGGGLVMLGGDRSFGAGGWIDSETARTLPVRLDPPQTRQILRGALALVMHSCEMPQGNYWGKVVAISAIEALSRLDYVGIVLFGMSGAGTLNGAGWTFPLQLAGDKSAALAAAKAMQVGDMPDFAPSMKLAYDGLVGVKGGQRHMIVISDGDPGAPPDSLLKDMAREKITATTVLVVGHGTAADHAKMENIAKSTNGRFYYVRNPRDLPKIFIKEASVVSRSLIQEGTFPANVQPMMSGPTKGVAAVPPVGGYVLTVPREGLGQVPIGIATRDARDPLLAFWNYGLGRSLAFTSDAAGRWGQAWISWPEFQQFWEQNVRWSMRPAQPRDVALRTSVDGTRASVEVEAFGVGGEAAARVDARVVEPDGTSRLLPLRQTGAGRWVGDFSASEQGAYLVNVGFAAPSADGEVRTGSVQAAVSVPYAKEFRAVRDNAALLSSVAARTGGRVLALGDPSLANLFDRTGIEVPRSAKRIWDLLAILAAALFILDVAARRIAFDSREARDAAARALGKVQEAGTGTVDAWRSARSRAATRVPGATPPEAPPPEPSPGAPRVPPPVPEGRDAPAQPVRPASQPPAADGAAEDPGGLGRLRAAKRRAQQGDGGAAPPGAGPGPDDPGNGGGR